jgi:hypothetical protein
MSFIRIVMDAGVHREQNKVRGLQLDDYKFIIYSYRAAPHHSA